MSTVSNLVVGLIVAVIVIAVAVRLLSWLYVKSSGETAFVRTGFGGRQVVLNGGALVIPVLHQTTPVNLSTLRLEVLRGKEAALSTADHMRVDVHVAFYVRVAQTAEAIALAAQTLGARTMDPQALTELVEGKFVDVLRAVAAGMTMQDLHRKRGDFVRAVKDAVAEDLARNGLELESVSLLDLDQTALQYFDSKNAFDAEGLTRVTEEIEKRRKARAAITQDTELAIRRKELEVQHAQLGLDKEHLAIGQEVEFARLAQAEAIAVRRAEQQAIIAAEEAQRRRRADEASIVAKLETGQAETSARKELELRQIESELAVATARIDVERKVKEIEAAKARLVEIAAIERERAVEQAREGSAAVLARSVQERVEAEREVAEAKLRAGALVDQAKLEVERALAVARAEAERIGSLARVAAEQAVREAEIQRQRAVDVARIEAGRILEIAEAERTVALAEAEVGVAAARARSSTARIEQVRTEEAVLTAQAEEQKAREKVLAALGAERLLIAATGEADADRTKAEAARRVAEIEAEARRLLNEADNALSLEQVSMRVKLRTIEQLPDIIRESVKPMERIDSIRIAQVEGLTRGGEGAALRDGLISEPRNLAEQVVDSALRYRAQGPLVDELLREVGIAGLAGATRMAAAAPARETLAEPAPVTLRADLSGVTALVTGASGTLGGHFARLLAANGARVVLVARRTDRLERLAVDIAKAGGQALPVAMDVTDAATVVTAFDAAERAFGPVTLLVNNSGIAGRGRPALQLDDIDFEGVIGVNLTGAWRVAREAARRMVPAGGGAIVNVASILGYGVSPGVASYAASKAALIQLTRALALEWARHGIRVNALAPGYVHTELNAEFFATEAGKAMIRRIPQRRLGEPSDLDGPLLLLASDASRFMTGSVLVADGGHLLVGA